VVRALCVSNNFLSRVESCLVCRMWPQRTCEEASVRLGDTQHKFHHESSIGCIRNKLSVLHDLRLSRECILVQCEVEHSTHSSHRTANNLPARLTKGPFSQSATALSRVAAQKAWRDVLAFDSRSGHAAAIARATRRFNASKTVPPSSKLCWPQDLALRGTA
jgi:hypothetical protein